MKKTQRLFVLILALCMLVQMLPVAAFEFEVPEAAEEIVEKADSAALSDDAIPGFPETTLDDSLGRLVAFWNFEGDDPLNVTWKDSIMWGAAYQRHTDAASESEAIYTNSVDGYSDLTSSALNMKYAMTHQFHFEYEFAFGALAITGKAFAKADGSIGYPNVDTDGAATVTDTQYFRNLLYPTSNKGHYVDICIRGTAKRNPTFYFRNYGADSDFVLDDLAFWSYPENSFILRPASGSTDGEMITCTKETYTFPSTYSGKTVTAWTDGTTLYYVGAEAPAVTEIAQKTFYPVDTTIPELYDSTYGQLVFYSGFNLPNNPLVNEIEEFSPIKGLSILKRTYSSLAVVDGRNAFKTQGGAFGNDSFLGIGVGASDKWKYTGTDTLASGTVYMVSDFYFDNDSLSGWSLLRAESQTGNDKYNVFGNTDPAASVRKWGTSVGKDKGAVIPSGTTDITLGWSNKAMNLYFNNTKVYIMPNNALWLASDETGANRTFAAISGDTYTFPTAFNDEAVTAWTDGTNLWPAGSEIAKATVAAKTIYPVRAAAAPAEYDETYGQLVWFDNFSGDTGFTNIADINLASYIATTATAKAGYSTLPAQQKEFSHHWYEIERNGDVWKYTDNNNLSGDITIYAEIYNALGGTVSLHTVVKVKDDTDATCQRKGKNYKNMEKQWGHWGIYDTPWGVKSPSDTKLQPQDWTTVYTWPITIGENDERFGINIYNTTANSFYARSLAVYIKPDNALWLIDSNGDNRAYEIASDETYTFPTNFNGADVLTWKNGTTTYAAGETVSIADIAAKTWQVAETVGLAFDDSVSVRVSGTPGIRFKTNLNLAAYTNADEIGFLATRNKHFVEQFGGLDENLVLTNNATNNKSYCTLVTIPGQENIKNYIVDAGDGETASFNAVVINVPERKATLTETLHLRSYVTCGGVTYYSAVRKESIYEAAKKISQSSGYQDNDYIKNILSICEDTSGN